VLSLPLKHRTRLGELGCAELMGGYMDTKRVSSAHLCRRLKKRSSSQLYRYQRGALLIEMMISASIGVFAIAIIGTVFLTGQSIAKERSLELLVLQSLMSTASMMRSDIQRAGFDGGYGQSIRLVGESDTIAISGGSMGFAYYSVDSSEYQHVKYKLNNGSLYSCEKKQSALLALYELTGCYNLLDQNVMNVVSFSVSTIPLATSSAQTLFTHIYLEAELVDGRYNHSVSMDVKQRNWL
jgi:type IV pilus assembly protein PilW